MSGAGGIQQGPVQFMPMDNIKTAEKWMKKNGVKVEYDGLISDGRKLEILNSHKEALSIYEQKLNIKVGDKFVSRLNGQTIEFGGKVEIVAGESPYLARQAQGKVWAYADKPKELGAIFKETTREIKSGEIPLFTFENQTDVIVHELAHTLENVLPKTHLNKWTKYFDDVGWKEQASFFGQENFMEMWAESVTAGLKGNIVNSGSMDEAFKVIKNVFGKELKK